MFVNCVFLWSGECMMSLPKDHAMDTRTDTPTSNITLTPANQPCFLASQCWVPHSSASSISNVCDTCCVMNMLIYAGLRCTTKDNLVVCSSFIVKATNILMYYVTLQTYFDDINITQEFLICAKLSKFFHAVAHITQIKQIYQGLYFSLFTLPCLGSFLRTPASGIRKERQTSGLRCRNVAPCFCRCGPSAMNRDGVMHLVTWIRKWVK